SVRKARGSVIRFTAGGIIQAAAFNPSISGIAFPQIIRTWPQRPRQKLPGRDTMADVVQVSRLLDQRGLSSFHYNLIFWSVLLSLIDGYDIAAIAFAAPHLVREW